MPTSTVKLLGRMVSLLLLAATGGIVYWQLQPIAPIRSVSSPVPRARTQRLPQIPTADELSKLADQRLRSPLYDPPPPPQPPPKKKKPTPPPRVDLQLIGTMIEKDRSRAVLRAPNGRTEIRGVGETVTLVPGRVVLSAVTADHVVVHVGTANGAEVTLTLEIHEDQ